MIEETNAQTKVQLEAVITCPICEKKQTVAIPAQGFQHYYKCTNQDCLADLSPTEGNDCIFCSYADTPCPTRQLNPDIDKPELHSLI